MTSMFIPPRQILNAAGTVAPGQTPALPSMRERLKGVLTLEAQLEKQHQFILKLLTMNAALHWKFHVDPKDIPEILREFIEATKVRIATEKMIKESPALKAVAESLNKSSPPPAGPEPVNETEAETDKKAGAVGESKP